MEIITIRQRYLYGNLYEEIRSSGEWYLFGKSDNKIITICTPEGQLFKYTIVYPTMVTTPGTPYAMYKGVGTRRTHRILCKTESEHAGHNISSVRWNDSAPGTP